ncbi:hypothetical protein, partial [Klebsiella pneumoniae]|uniref:hypothetical protein n=1 Tax=Klebsiella pneumoniae TaxID=573 RepID=UPI001EF7B874
VIQSACSASFSLLSSVNHSARGEFFSLRCWIGGMLCVVTWFHLERQFWTPQNFTIPVIVTLWGLSLFATPLMELLNKKMPWYRLLVPDAKHTSTEATNDDQP